MSSRIIKGPLIQDAQNERRKSERRPILDTFSIFGVVAKKSVCRLSIHDVSEAGIGFDLDTEGESFADFPVKIGQTIDLDFYLNQTLCIPLQLKIMRIDESGKVRKIGAEYVDRASKSYQALISFLTALDHLKEAGKIEVKKPDPPATQSPTPEAPDSSQAPSTQEPSSTQTSPPQDPTPKDPTK